jgi:hypothetical protein
MDYVVTGRTRAFRTTSFTMEFAVWLPDPSGAACTATGEAIIVLLNRDAPGRHPIPEAGRTAFIEIDGAGRDPLIPFIFPKIRTATPRPEGPPTPNQAPRTKGHQLPRRAVLFRPVRAPVSTGSSASASSLPSSTPHWSKLLIPRITPSTKTRCS